MQDTNLSWSFIKQQLAVVCDQSPTFKVPSHPSPLWFNADIRHSLNKIHSLRRLIKNKSTSSRLAKLSILESDLQSQMITSKDSFISDLISSFTASKL